MSFHISALKPIEVKINWWNKLKLCFMLLVSTILWLVLFVAGMNLLIRYIILIFSNGFFAEETLKYALLIVIGAYFCLVLDKNKIYDALDIKRDLPFITLKSRNGKN